MTAGMTTQKLEGSRVSLPRAGLGALLAITLLAGGLVGAAVYATVGTAMAQPVAVSVPHASSAVRQVRIPAGPGLHETTRTGTTGTTNPPALRDGFDPGVAPTRHAPFTYVPAKSPLR